MGIVPSNCPEIGSKALISLSTRLKLPTSRSPPNSTKLAEAKATPQGATSEPLMIVCSKFPRPRGGTVAQAMRSWAAQRRSPSRSHLLVTLPRAASRSRRSVAGLSVSAPAPRSWSDFQLHAPVLFAAEGESIELVVAHKPQAAVA